MNELDKAYLRLIKYIKTKDYDNIDWSAEMTHLQALTTEENIKTAHDQDMYLRLLDISKHNTKAKILDYGCGGGQLVIYFLLLGYQYVYGIDVSEELAAQNNDFALRLGLTDSTHFFTNDRNKLPFDKGQFDIIISQQVLEHVQDLDLYYRESSRVLNDRGIAIVSHPHKLQPYDTHAKRWFIHYFPKGVRKYLYDWFTESGHKYYEQILNLKTVSYHKNLAIKYFSLYKVTTQQRISNFIGSEHYEGPRMLRQIAHILMNLKIIGPFCQKFFMILAQNDAMIYKNSEDHLRN